MCEVETLLPDVFFGAAEGEGEGDGDGDGEGDGEGSVTIGSDGASGVEL